MVGLKRMTSQTLFSIVSLPRFPSRGGVMNVNGNACFLCRTLCLFDLDLLFFCLQYPRLSPPAAASKLQHNRPSSLIVGGEPQSERQQRSAEGRPPSQFLPPPSPISSPLAPSAYVTNAVLSNSGYGHYSGVTGFVSSNLPVVSSDPRLSVRRPLEFHGVTSSTSYSSLSSGSHLSLATATTNSSVPSPTPTPRRTSLAPTHSSPQLKHNQEFSAVLLLEEPLDVRFDDPPYFDANRPARHMMESWDGRDETAERSAWDEVIRDNTTALKQASVVCLSSV
jgi:hypothetical protein